jgi:type III pantothenate kinase
MHAECGLPPVVLVTVVPEITEHLPQDLDLRVVDHTSELPFALEVTAPAKVGPDRLCNVAAAAAAGLGSALIVDAGTATTFDILLDGSFIGGMIAPGMASAAAGLATQTARLDPVPFGPAAWTAGNDTESAMRAGAWHTGVGGIRHTVKGLVDRYGPLPVILTGGLGVHLVDAGWYFDPHWTLRGAAILSKV